MIVKYPTVLGFGLMRYAIVRFLYKMIRKLLKIVFAI